MSRSDNTDMSRKRRKSGNPPSLARPLDSNQRTVGGKHFHLLVSFLAAGVVIVAGFSIIPSWRTPLRSTQADSAASEVSAAGAAIPQSYHDLLAMTEDELARIDIAVANLLCAKQLPGAQSLDIPAVLKKLDEWTARVKSETDKYYPQFLQNPADYNSSEADFRMLTLVTVLQQDLGVEYNVDRIEKPDFKNSQDLFIHGMVGSDNGGTCVSMPILYIAVGQRLGYPLKLVLAREHTFVRWQGNGERLNIEGSSRGMMTYPDQHYHAWPKPIKEEWLRSGEFLTSLTPQEALADFLASRGHCLSDNALFDEAEDCYRAAARLNPKSQAYPYFFAVNEARAIHRRSGGKEPLKLPADPYGQ